MNVQIIRADLRNISFFVSFSSVVLLCCSPCLLVFVIVFVVVIVVVVRVCLSCLCVCSFSFVICHCVFIVGVSVLLARSLGFLAVQNHDCLFKSVVSGQ